MATKFSGVLPKTINREKATKKGDYVRNEDGKKLYKGYFNYYIDSHAGQIKSYNFRNWTKKRITKHEEMLIKSKAHTYVGMIRVPETEKTSL